MYADLFSRLKPDSLATLTAFGAIFLALSWQLWYLGCRARYHYKVRDIPYAHGVGLFGRWLSASARNEFIGDFRAIMRKGFAKNKYAFRVQTDLGEVIVLAPQYAEEIREDAGLSAGVYTNRELMGFIPGMEVFAFSGTHRGLMRDVITKRLNRACPQLIKTLSIETEECLREQWTDRTEWHAVPLYGTILDIVAQVSTCAFLGKDMARNRRWVELNSLYTTVGLGAVMALRPWPRFLLPIVHRLHPSVRATQKVLAEARQIMNSILEKRQAAARSGSEKREQDSLDWFSEVAAYRRETFDPTVAQLTFGVASMHSTSDELAQVLIDLRDKPQVVSKMREELLFAVTRLGWTHVALGQLKLMDSVLKETQRLKPINRVFNKRAVLKDIELSNGVYLPKGAFIAVSSDRTRDPAVYEDPDRYDAYRYIKRSQTHPETARFCGFSSVSLEATGFGFGKHACPGRSYVTQELKILLAHIILKYDWKFVPGYEPQYMNNGFDSMTDVTTLVLVKKRTAEVAFPA